MTSVWAQIINSLKKIRSIFAEDETLAAGLKSFMLKLVSMLVENIGWTFSPNDSFLTGQLRALIIQAAASAGHKE